MLDILTLADKGKDSGVLMYVKYNISNIPPLYSQNTNIVSIHGELLDLKTLIWSYNIHNLVHVRTAIILASYKIIKVELIKL